jgi:hypothetical protein
METQAIDALSRLILKSAFVKVIVTSEADDWSHCIAAKSNAAAQSALGFGRRRQEEDFCS